MGAGALIQVAVRHLGSYLELGASAATEWRSTLTVRLILMMAALLTGTIGLAALWVLGLIAVWESPWRAWYAAISALLLLGLSAWFAVSALAPASAGSSSRILGSELRKDMELFQQWKSTL